MGARARGVWLGWGGQQAAGGGRAVGTKRQRHTHPTITLTPTRLTCVQDAARAQVVQGGQQLGGVRTHGTERQADAAAILFGQLAQIDVLEGLGNERLRGIGVD